MKYTLNFKATEYTDETDADSLNEAAQIFYNRLPWEAKEEWRPEFLKRHIYEEKEEKHKEEPEVSMEMIEETRATSQ